MMTRVAFVLAALCSATLLADVPVAWPTRTVKTFTVAAAGGRSSYSQATGRVCYDQEEDDDLFDVHCMDLDGANDTCVTCDHASLDNNGQIGNPRLSASGTHMAFQAEDTTNGCTDAQAHPGVGGGNDVWIMRMDTLAVVKVIDVVSGSCNGGSIYCQWGVNDTKLACGTRTQLTPSFAAHITICDVETIGDASVSNCVNHAPAQADVNYEVGSFMPDDSVLGTCICDNTDTGIDDFDIFRYWWKTGRFVQLTDQAGASTTVLDEHPYAMNNPTQDGRIIWASSRGVPSDYLAMDWYIMNGDGTNVQRLTYFKDPTHPMYSAAVEALFGTEWVDNDTFIGSLIISLAGQRPANMYQFDIGVIPINRRTTKRGVRVNGS